MAENNTSDDKDNLENNTRKGLLGRRRFMQAAGAAGAGLIGTNLIGTVAAEDFNHDFANLRVQEARKAWLKGFRGQPDRTIGLLGQGLEARHPDIGPWNGIRAVPDGDRGLKAVRENLVRLNANEKVKFFEGSFGPNVGTKRNEHHFTAPEDADRVEAHLFGSPVFVARSLKLLLESPDGNVLAECQGISLHSAISAYIDGGEDYVFAVETTFPNNARADYTLDANYHADNPDENAVPFENVDPDNITADTPKVIGWYNEDCELSEATAKPRSGPRRQRSTGYASIMAGTGRASTIDETTVTEESPDEVLVGPDSALTYTVDVKPGRGVYGSAYGENIELKVYGPDGGIIHQSLFDTDETGNNRTNVTIQRITVHDKGEKTYTIKVVPADRFSFIQEPGIVAPVARVKRVSVGAFKKPDNTAGDRTAIGSPTLHAGIAPNIGLLGISGMYKTKRSLEYLAEDFAEMFNLRALQVAMGMGVRPGFAAGKFSNPESMKALAKAGILPVSQTDNVPAPASQADRMAALADESISVILAGPNDGIHQGSFGDSPAADEDGEGVYLKPDVTALGGNEVDNVTHAANADPYRSEENQKPIRKYTENEILKQGPYVVGQAGLVAEAMETAAPAGIVLPPPSKAGFADTMRLKQTILATASETPFTAAPWHRQEPTYDFGGHDPVEGWGRVNIDASVEAVSRDLTPQAAKVEAKRRRKRRGDTGRRDGEQASRVSKAKKTTKIDETVGLDVPRHSRAFAGYIAGDPGIYRVKVKFSKYTGNHKQMAAGPPHIDLFVYDAENPAQHGTPNIVARATDPTGSPSLRFRATKTSGGDSEGGTYYVVAKLVNVPQSHNSFDVRAHLNLSVKLIN